LWGGAVRRSRRRAACPWVMKIPSAPAGTDVLVHTDPPDPAPAPNPSRKRERPHAAVSNFQRSGKQLPHTITTIKDFFLSF